MMNIDKMDNVPSYCSLDEYFDFLRHELEMDLSHRWNLTSLHEYINSYNFALSIHNIDEYNSFSVFNPWFNDWIRMKEPDQNEIIPWHIKLAQITKSDAEGLELFFQYYDEYKSREVQILWEYQISYKDINELVNISNQSDEDKKEYIGCTLQIISYDQDKEGVFERWLAPNQEDLYEQYIFYNSYENAIKSIQEKFNMNFERNLHIFRIACAWERTFETLYLPFGQPDSLPKISTLTNLHLASWNDFYKKHIPLCFPNLEHLEVDFFNEEDLQGLKDLKSLKSLTLRYGALKSLNGIEHLTHLEEIHIFMLGLADIDALQYCTQLQILHLESHSELLTSINLSHNRALREMRIEHTPHLKYIYLENGVNHSVIEKIVLSGMQSLESLDWLVHCSCLSLLALSFTASKKLSVNLALHSTLTYMYCDCQLDQNSIQLLLSNVSIRELFLSESNTIQNFAWLTPHHQLERCYIYFSGQCIDWEKIFSCISYDWKVWQISCMNELTEESSIEEIRKTASHYNHQLGNNIIWPSQYISYRF